MSNTNKLAFSNGMRDGIPIATGYFAVAFTLGIAAKNAGFTPLQAMIVSMTNNASAGEYAGFTLISQNAGYLELALMMLVANARYLLMSCALSQNLDAGTSLLHRMLIGYDVTDEIFGISSTVDGKLNPFYNYGAACVASPGWVLGTFLGALVGNILPANVASAMNVALYGMFLAIIIPPAKKNAVIAIAVIVSFICSYLCGILPLVRNLSDGTRTIILTILISSVIAIIKPVKDEEMENSENQGEVQNEK